MNDIHHQDTKAPRRPAPSLGDEEAAAAISRELAGAARVSILAHIRPDGDAVGSSLALASILRAAGREAEVVLSDVVPRQFRFLEGVDGIPPGRGVAAPGEAGETGNVPEKSQVAPLVIALDTSTHERLGRAAPIYDAAARRACIDHHVSCSLRGDVNWIDPGAAAVGEMIWRLARALEMEVPPGARDALYVAIMTDTGRFTHSNTTAETFETAAALVRAGADPEMLARKVYGEKPLAEWELECRARRSLSIELGGRVATIGIGRRDFEETGTSPSSTEDLSALSRLVEGVEVGLFFKELEGGAGGPAGPGGGMRTKVSIRTARAVDANRLAARMGGGGHPQAAGCTIEAALDEARRTVLAETERFLKDMSADGRKGRGE